MAFSPDYRTYTGTTGAATSAASIDAGLRAYMLRVYNWMTSGLVLTGIIAYGIAHTSLSALFYHQVMSPRGVFIQPTGLGVVAMLAPLAFTLVLSFGIQRLSVSTAQLLYWLFCAAMGASLTNILMIYTETSVVRTFFIAAGTFAAMSIWGYTTRTDLTKFGSFLFMGLIGVVLASLVNMFVGSSGLQFIISVVGVLVFVGLTAFDTQRIKATYVQVAFADGPQASAKRSVYDALGLYLNFINLFLLLLQLTGSRSNN